MSEKPECPVCAGSGFVNRLARLGVANDFACWCCNTIFREPEGYVIGEVTEEWQLAPDDVRKYGELTT